MGHRVPTDRQLPQTALVHGTKRRMASLTPDVMPHKDRLQCSHREFPLVPSITACDIMTDQPVAHLADDRAFPLITDLRLIALFKMHQLPWPTCPTKYGPRGHRSLTSP